MESEECARKKGWEKDESCLVITVSRSASKSRCILATAALTALLKTRARRPASALSCSVTPSASARCERSWLAMTDAAYGQT